MISIIIPAHNESRVIERCLDHITRGAEPGELEVIVVCNGCTDDTAELARRFSSTIRVLETDRASKAHALNLGDRASRGFPRIFVDADVLISIDAIREVAEVLEEGEALVAAPRIEVDTEGVSWTVRAFYQVWTELPYFHTEMIGSGVYGLSREGRSRFRCFPDIIADDSYVRLSFTRAQRRSVASCSFTIFAPSTLRDLLKIKSRGRLGAFQFQEVFPDLAGRDAKPYFPAMIRVLKRPSLWPAIPVYCLVALLTRCSALRRFRTRDFGTWDRDDSARSRD